MAKSLVKDIKEKDKIRAKTGQNQEQTGSVKKSKVKPDEVKSQSKPKNIKDKIICDLDKTPDLSQRPSQNYPKCGNPVDGHYCQGCALFRKKFKEDLFTYCNEYGILQDSSKPSNDNINVVDALQEPFVINQDPDYTITITHKEPDNSLSMGDKHLDTVSATESNEFIKSSVENLVRNPSESKDEHECDVPTCEVFTTFSNILFDADYDFYYSNDQSFYDKYIPKEIYSNPLFDEEIISMKIDLHHFNTESHLIESLLNHDSLIISSSSKIDSLFDEFASELTLLKSISSGINETDCDPEEEIRLIKRLLYDLLDIDSLMEEIDISFTLNDPMLPGIEEDDYDSEKDILILEEFISNDSLLLPKNESFHFDIPSSCCPPAKPPDGELRGEIGITIFRNALRAQYLSHSSMYVSPPSITTVRPWFEMIGYNRENEVKGTLNKSCLPPRWRLLMGQIIQCLGGKTGGLDQISNKDATILYCLANVVSAAKLPILNPNEFYLWKMRIEQYFLITDYSLWEVILNGDYPVPTRIVEGVVQPVAPTTAEQKLSRKNELKARGLDQIHDRLQKLVSQLEIHGVSLSQEDVNLKFLCSLPSEWKTDRLLHG
nr:hypothetical protein [Tanacetum cinerariifolium]